MADIGKLEYRVCKVERFIVTRYHEGVGGRIGGVEGKGEYDNANVAHEVAYALCKAEHKRLGFQEDDPRIKYPSRQDLPVGGLLGVPSQRHRHPTSQRE